MIDVRASLRLRNDRILKARESLGLTQVGCAAAAGIPSYLLQALEKFDCYGIEHGNRRWTQVHQLAEFLGLEFDDVAPPGVIGRKARADVTRVASVGTEGLLGLGRSAQRIATDPLAKLITRSQREEVERGLGVLSKRQSTVVRGLFGIGGPVQTHEAIAKRLRVSRTRVSQIRNKSLTKLGVALRDVADGWVSV